MPDGKMMLHPTMGDLMGNMMDVTGAEGVEVTVSTNGILWVNVNGICLLRICQIKYLEVNGTVIKDA